MSNGVEVMDIEGTDVVFIRIVANIKDLSWQINEVHALIREHIEGKGIEADGHIYAAYHRLEPPNCDIEIGITTAVPVEGSDGISSGRICASKALQAKYIGAYIPVIMTCNYLDQWMNENGYSAVGPRYEFYEGDYFDPTNSRMTTRILIPIEKDG